MLWQQAGFGALEGPWLWAQSTPQTASLLSRLSERDRLRVVAALAVILVAAGFLVLFIRATGRVARWYVNRRPRATQALGDPHQPVVDSKPRPWQQEAQNWQRR